MKNTKNNSKGRGSLFPKVLVVGGLTEKGLEFISTLKNVYLVVYDSPERVNKNLMRLLAISKVKLYDGNPKDKAKIDQIRKEEKIDETFNFSNVSFKSPRGH